MTPKFRCIEKIKKKLEKIAEMSPSPMSYPISMLSNATIFELDGYVIYLDSIIEMLTERDKLQADTMGLLREATQQLLDRAAVAEVREIKQNQSAH